MSVLEKFKSATDQEGERLKAKIQSMEQIVKKPYTKEKQMPYYLHAIMIHDGVADNGHYYVYIYDRIQKFWWKLNDHFVKIEDEDTVFREAFGGDANKTACNIVYMSKHIANQID